MPDKDHRTDRDAARAAAALIHGGAAGGIGNEADMDCAAAALLRALEAGRNVPRGSRADMPLWAFRDDLT